MGLFLSRFLRLVLLLGTILRLLTLPLRRLLARVALGTFSTAAAFLATPFVTPTRRTNIDLVVQRANNWEAGLSRCFQLEIGNKIGVCENLRPYATDTELPIRR